jgi:CTP synthase (UTP-ammonia lyase)
MATAPDVQALRIGLVGDHDASVPAHQAIPLALQKAATLRGLALAIEWVPTAEITASRRVLGYHGLWCVPGSPYRSMAGALTAIRHARECEVPFLGSCGGFQHALVEYARNVLGWQEAEHAETAPAAALALIAPLECALVEASESVRLLPGTRIARAYGGGTAQEGYHCRYGLDPRYRGALLRGPLRASAEDERGDVRAVELDGHPFFVATLFQPERAALAGRPVPLARAFLAAAAAVSSAA